MIVLETLGERLADAGLNSLVCIAVVFSVLIFISLVISLFGFIPKAEAAIACKKEAKKSQNEPETEAVLNTVSQIETRETEEMNISDELELVAVISAAIAASSGTPTDGFVVRSIRKIRR